MSRSSQGGLILIKKVGVGLGLSGSICCCCPGLNYTWEIMGLGRGATRAWMAPTLRRSLVADRLWDASSAAIFVSRDGNLKQAGHDSSTLTSLSHYQLKLVPNPTMQAANPTMQAAALFLLAGLNDVISLA